MVAASFAVLALFPLFGFASFEGQEECRRCCRDDFFVSLLPFCELLLLLPLPCTGSDETFSIKACASRCVAKDLNLAPE